MNLFPEQCRAARGLLNWTQADLAENAGTSRSTVRDFEGERHQLHRSTEMLLIRTLEAAGVRLLPPDDEGPGARLAKRPVARG
jgi:transcriptional regulator with XRE-family HTH domain